MRTDLAITLKRAQRRGPGCSRSSAPGNWCIARRSRWTLPARAPAYPVRLPELPHGLRLTRVTFAPDVVCLTASVSEWQMDLPRKRLEDILGQLSVAGVPLNLTRLTRLL